MSKEQKILLGILALVGISVAGIYVELQKSQNQLAVTTVDTNSSTETNNMVATPASQPTTPAVTQAVTSTNLPVQTVSQKIQIKTTPAQTVAQPISSAKTVSTTVRFNVPEGHSDSLTVTATVKDGIITSINYNQRSSNRDSEEYYQSFENSFSSASVVGKKIGSVQLSRVGGASLTTEAFNQALSNLAQQI